MNFLPASVDGTHLETPLGRFDMKDEAKAAAVKDRPVVLVGIRPEAFEDLGLVTAEQRARGSQVRVTVDVTEWLGNELYAYVPYEAPEDVRKQLRDLSRELDSDQLRTQAVVALNPNSAIRDGQEVDLWIDLGAIHIFDPATGENLTRNEERAADLAKQGEELRAQQRQAQEST